MKVVPTPRPAKSRNTAAVPMVFHQLKERRMRSAHNLLARKLFTDAARVTTRLQRKETTRKDAHRHRLSASLRNMAAVKMAKLKPQDLRRRDVQRQHQRKAPRVVRHHLTAAAPMERLRPLDRTALAAPATLLNSAAVLIMFHQLAVLKWKVV